MRIIFTITIAVICMFSSLSFSQISGIVFADYFYNVARDSVNSTIPNAAIRGDKDAHGFQFRRVNLTYDYKISEVLSTRFRVEGEDGVTTSNSRYAIFLKDMWLKWRFADGHDLIVGMQPPPAFEVSEFYWRYRALEKTILDLRGFVSSRDIGISLKGRIDSKGVVNYWGMFGNGSGVTPESDRHKRYYAHLHYKPSPNFEATIYGDFRARDRVQSPLLLSETVPNNEITWAAFAGYMEKDKYALGLEWILNSRENAFITGGELKSRNAMGLSFFGSYEINDLLGLLIRYDWFDPNTDVDNDRRNFIIGGANIKLDKMVHIIPNIMVETYESAGVQIEPSVTARITFNYRF